MLRTVIKCFQKTYIHYVILYCYSLCNMCIGIGKSLDIIITCSPNLGRESKLSTWSKESKNLIQTGHLIFDEPNHITKIYRRIFSRLTKVLLDDEHNVFVPLVTN